MLTDNANTVQSHISLPTLISAPNDALVAFSTPPANTSLALRMIPTSAGCPRGQTRATAQAYLVTGIPTALGAKLASGFGMSEQGRAQQRWGRRGPKCSGQREIRDLNDAPLQGEAP
jgi:hypothetical protein